MTEPLKQSSEYVFTDKDGNVVEPGTGTAVRGEVTITDADGNETHIYADLQGYKDPEAQKLP